jgi:hypothetical protein
MGTSMADLITPLPSGIGPGSSQSNPPANSWLAVNLANAATVGLTPTAWQSGSPTRSLLAVSAVDQAKQDASICQMVMGGFLDWAATGTVSYVDPNGHTITWAVSPDPSDPSSGNTNGAPTWLDMLCGSNFGVTRLPASPVTLTITLANTSVTTPTTYLPGTYHVQDISRPQSTYSNDAALTISPSTVLGTSITAISNSGTIQITTATAHGLSTGVAVFITGAPAASNANGFWQVTVTGANTFLLNNSTAGSGGSAGSVYSTMSAAFTADAAGTQYSAAAGDISLAISSNTGVSVTNFAPCTGANWESNANYVARTRLAFAALSPRGASAAYEYFALTSFSILSSVGVTLGCGAITRVTVSTNPLTGTVTTCVAPGSLSSTTQGAAVVSGATGLVATAATNASPILVTVPNHGLTNGELVECTGFLGNTGANGTYAILVNDANSFYLIGSHGTGTYTGGGQIDAGDLGAIDSIIQDNSVPDGDVAYTVPALTQLIAIVGTATVPIAQQFVYKANLVALLTSYVNAMPVGGYPLTGGGNGLPIDVVIGLFYQAGYQPNGTSYVTNVSGVAVNGYTTDLVFSPTLMGCGVGVVYPEPTITVVGA